MKEYIESLLYRHAVYGCVLGNYGGDHSPLDAIRLQDVSLSLRKSRRHSIKPLLPSRCTQNTSVNSVVSVRDDFLVKSFILMRLPWASNRGEIWSGGICDTMRDRRAC